MSPYLELLQDVEWGYNRDQEHLPQVSLCMLMGETSRLSIYQVLYSGSLKDVSTLDTALAKMDGRGVLFANSCRLFLALTTACPEGHEMATTSKLLGAGVTYSPRERSG